MSRIDSFVSVVAVLDDRADETAEFVQRTARVLEAEYTNYEIVLVDDGTRDGTAGVADYLLGVVPCLRYVRLSRRFGKDIATLAGLETAIGDAVVVLSPGVDPPEEIPAVVRSVLAGNAVVTGAAVRRRSRMRRWGRAVVAGVCRRMVGVPVTVDRTTLCGMSREAVTAITRSKERMPKASLLAAMLGLSTATHNYRPEGGEDRRRSAWSAVAEAMDVSMTNSKHPLRIVSYVGATAAALNLAYVLYIVGVHIVREEVAEGWTTLSLQMAGMFFLICGILTMMCEYIGRILEESLDRPRYHVVEERCSAKRLSRDGAMRNVTDWSVVREDEDRSRERAA